MHLFFKHVQILPLCSYSPPVPFRQAAISVHLLRQTRLLRQRKRIPQPATRSMERENRHRKNRKPWFLQFCLPNIGKLRFQMFLPSSNSIRTESFAQNKNWGFYSTLFLRNKSGEGIASLVYFASLVTKVAFQNFSDTRNWGLASIEANEHRRNEPTEVKLRMHLPRDEGCGIVQWPCLPMPLSH